MKTSTEKVMLSLENDIDFCKFTLGLTDDDTNDFIHTCYKMGISTEYFADEFCFDLTPDGMVADADEILRLHDPNYLAIRWTLEDDGDS